MRPGAGVTLGVALVVAAIAGCARTDDGAAAAGESLADAAIAGDLDLARTLIEEGVDPDEPRVNGFTPLMRAAIRDDAPMVRLLLDAGADLEATELAGLTTWHLAAEADAVDALGALIDAGVDLGARSANGMNTLEHAASAGAVDVIGTIAATGADLDAQSESATGGHGYPRDIGPTALAIAARSGHLEAVRTLLDLGADVDAPSAIGQTALFAAIFSGQAPELVSALLDAGADPTIQVACDSGCAHPPGDALDWARRLGFTDLVPVLEDALEG